MISLTAVLFAGGEARRLGADKATLLWEGEPLWSRQLRTLRELAPEKILISARTKPAWCPPEIETVLDEPPSRGPLSGIVAALKKMETTHLLALAVDLPLMTAGHLKKLLSLAQPGRGVVPAKENLHEPLCAIYPKESERLICNHLAGGGASLQPLIDRLAGENLVTLLPVSKNSGAVYDNLNTPQDFARIFSSKSST
jgi:molybdopterin-guanine dinucleotide biosynthesis protein A